MVDGANAGRPDIDRVRLLAGHTDELFECRYIEYCRIDHQRLGDARKGANRLEIVLQVETRRGIDQRGIRVGGVSDEHRVAVGTGPRDDRSAESSTCAA